MTTLGRQNGSWIKALAAKSAELGSIPGTLTMVEEEN